MQKTLVKSADRIFLDRIDIQCEIQAVAFKDLSNVQPGEPSSAIRERVIAARNIQTERFKEYYNSLSPKGERGGVRGFVHCNAQMTDRMIHQYCVLDQQTLTILQAAMERMNLSARAYSRILKVARSISDLAGSENVMVDHLAEGISYRNLDMTIPACITIAEVKAKQKQHQAAIEMIKEAMKVADEISMTRKKRSWQTQTYRHINILYTLTR